MKPDEAKNIIEDLQRVNRSLYESNLILKIEYRKNLKVLINVITGRLSLTETQSKLVNMTLQQRLCVTKLRLCISMLSTNFN